MIHCLNISTSINEILFFGMISHVLVNSYVGGINTPKSVNTCLINRQLATQHPIVRLFTKKLIAQLEIRHSSLKTLVGEDGKRRTKETVA